MNLNHFFKENTLADAKVSSSFISNRQDHFKVLAKYKCKMNHVRCRVFLGDEYVIIQNKDSNYKLACSEIKDVTIQEKLWSIRVKVHCKKCHYQLDFPSYKVATKFYEQLIYRKIKALIK